MSPDQLLRVAEAARILRVKPGTIRRWIAQGRLPATRTAGGRHYRILRADMVFACQPARRSS